MKTMIQEIGRPPVIYMERPVSGLTSPEFQDFAQAVINAIARATKNGFRTIGGGVVRVWRYLDSKWTEGAEIHNRQRQMMDERYTRNFYHMRSYL